MTTEHQSVRIDVSTPDVAALALDLQRIADRLDQLGYRYVRAGCIPEIRDVMEQVRWVVRSVSRDVGRAAEETARVGLSYLAHDVRAQQEFLVAWNHVPLAHGNRPHGVFGQWGTGPYGLPPNVPVLGLDQLANNIVGTTMWAGTALAAAWAFLAPTTASVSSFRAMASELGGFVESRQTHAREELSPNFVATAGATRSLAAEMTAVTNPGKPDIAVTAARVSSAECAPPSGFEDLINRIPRAQPGGAQVRIDRVGSTAIVYVGGTVSDGLSGGAEPWDMGSNIAALGGATSDSERGVRDAMRRAGASDAPRIILVGHSQGALVAQRLAADPGLKVSDVVTVGAPVQPGGIPARVRVTTIENANDPIPALGGNAGLDSRDVSVRRTEDIHIRGDALAAHHIGAYRETAGAMDRSVDPVLVQVRENIAETLKGPCTSSSWRAERQP